MEVERAVATPGPGPHRPALLYRPAEAWVGDVIPFFWEGLFHVFYLLDDRDIRGPWRGLDWGHVTSRDLVAFEEQPIAVPRGGADELDLICGTGSVTAMPDGRFLIYYAGINPGSRERGHPEQVVLRAYSADLIDWVKDTDFVLEADERWYERDDWRDPFLYRDDAGRWRMLLTARTNTGPSDRRGCIALAVSDDLETWRIEPPLLWQGTTRAPECPDLFVEGEQAYLVYSSFSDRFATRYRVAPGTGGAWRAQAEDALEAPDVYAMKTVSDGTRRYLLGWLATRAGERDSGHRQWGGDLLVHEVMTRSDGTLGVKPLQALLDRFTSQPALPMARIGGWEIGADTATFDGEGVGWLSFGPMAATCLVEVTLDLRHDAEELAVVLRAEAGLEYGYHLRLESKRGRVVFDRRPHAIRIPFDPGSDRGYVDAADHEIERPLRSDDGLARVRIVADGAALIVYVNDVALSTRGYDLTAGEWGVLAVGGRAVVRAPRAGVRR
jgi:beta-fructofuranosidase